MKIGDRVKLLALHSGPAHLEYLVGTEGTIIDETRVGTMPVLFHVKFDEAPQPGVWGFLEIDLKLIL